MKLFLILGLLLSFNTFAAPVNVNTASAQEIASSLNGIGLKKAEAIVEYRKKNGKFTTAAGLSNVKGIGDKTIAKNKKDIKL
ncbi:MAG: helix-hairpin-helix domain-containing protein [Methyloprofundus sp.]|nr:helix-hairpin-helix domain-containing protein [Methyloprofundus sp.]